MVLDELYGGVKTYVLTILGHGLAGGLVGFAYGLIDYLPLFETGGVSAATVVTGVTVAAALGLARSIVDTAKGLQGGAQKVQVKGFFDYVGL